MRLGAARVARAHSTPKKPGPPATPGAVSKFMQGLILAFIVMVLAGAGAYKILGLGGGVPEGDPAELAEQAREALDAVSKRDLSATMSPPKYDDILIPIDQLLREAHAKLQSPGYDPIRDSEYVLARVVPVPEIADAAHMLALNEKTFLKKEYRFMEQKADACLYRAGALWNRWEAEHARERDGEAFAPDAGQADQLTEILSDGLSADPENRDLWYLRALVERSGGGFAAAEESLGRALAIDPEYVAAWNDLGLARISLKEFDKAEEAFVRAKDLAKRAYEDAGMEPGGDYLTALMNLADFHDALASFYTHEARVNPTEENERELRRHTDAAKRCTSEIRQYAPYTPPSEKVFG